MPHPDPYAEFSHPVEAVPQAGGPDPYAEFSHPVEAVPQAGGPDPYAEFSHPVEAPSGWDWSAQDVLPELAKGAGSGSLQIGASPWTHGGVALQGLSRFGKWAREALGITAAEPHPVTLGTTLMSGGLASLPSLAVSAPQTMQRVGSKMEEIGATGSRAAQEGILTPTENLENKPLARTARGIGAMAPAVVATALGQPQIGLSLLATQAAGETERAAREAGADEATSLGLGGLSGAGAYLFGKIPLGTIEGKLAKLALSNFNVKDGLAKVGAKKLVDYATAAAVNAGGNGLQAAYQDALAMGYGGDLPTFARMLDATADGALMGLAFKGLHDAKTPRLARMRDVQRNLAQDFGAENVQPFGDTGFEVNSNGKKIIVEFKPDAAGLGEANVDGIVESAKAEEPGVWERTLAETGGDVPAAKAKIVNRFGPVGATRSNYTATDPATGAKVNADVWIGLVAGKASVGKISHETIHQTAILSGLRQDGDLLVDPVTGASMPEENVAVALGKGVDHPVLRRIKDAALGFVNMFRTEKGETPFQIARRLRRGMLEEARRKQEDAETILEPPVDPAAEAAAEKQAQAFDPRVSVPAEPAAPTPPALMDWRPFRATLPDKPLGEAMEAHRAAIAAAIAAGEPVNGEAAKWHSLDRPEGWNEQDGRWVAPPKTTTDVTDGADAKIGVPAISGQRPPPEIVVPGASLEAGPAPAAPEQPKPFKVGLRASAAAIRAMTYEELKAAAAVNRWPSGESVADRAQGTSARDLRAAMGDHRSAYMQVEGKTEKAGPSAETRAKMSSSRKNVMAREEEAAYLDHVLAREVREAMGRGEEPPKDLDEMMARRQEEPPAETPESDFEGADVRYAVEKVSLEETSRRIGLVRALKPIAGRSGYLTPEDASVAYDAIGSARASDGRNVAMVRSTFGKLTGHQNATQIMRIIPQLGELLESSVPAYTERERQPERHRNIVAYHNYVTKVTLDGRDYYVRMTAQEVRKPGGDELHNAALSDVEMTEASVADVHSGIIRPAKIRPTGPVDKRLVQWLASVKPEGEARYAVEAKDREGVDGRGKISRMITPEQDQAYLDAVERGDMDAAQKMVDSILEQYEGSYNEAGKFQWRPEVTSVGVRIGNVPAGGRSFNQRDNRLENGLSLIGAGNLPSTQSFAISGLKDKGAKSVYLRGKVRTELGGDDEFLMTEAEPISKEEYQKALASDSQTLADYLLSGYRWNLAGRVGGDTARWIAANKAAKAKINSIVRAASGRIIPLSERFDSDVSDSRYAVAAKGEEGPAKPRFANPGEQPEARRYLAAEQARREAAGESPAHKTDVQIRAEANAILKDREGAWTALKAGKLALAEDAGAMQAAKRMIDERAQVAVTAGDTAALAEVAKAYARYEKAGSEAGRAFRERRDTAASPEERAQRALMDALLEPPKAVKTELEKATTPEQKAAIEAAEGQRIAATAKAVERATGLNPAKLSKQTLRDSATVAEMIREIEARSARGGDKAFEYWRNALLSAPSTQVSNIVGNTAAFAWDRAIQKTGEGLLNVVLRRQDATQLGELGPMWRATFGSLGKAGRQAMLAFSTEQPLIEGRRMEESGVAIGRGNKVGRFVSTVITLGETNNFGRVARTPQRLLLAADEFAKTVVYDGTIAALAYRTAKAEGLRGEALAERQAELRTNPTEKMVGDALDEARRLTYQEKPGAIAAGILQMRQNVPGLRYIVPFVSTPANILKQGLQKSPLGTARLAWKAARGEYKGEGAKLVKDVAEQLIAWSAFAAVGSLIQDDDGEPQITGNRPPKGVPAGERALQQKHYPPQSIRLGGRWYSYARIEPLATSLSTMVDAWEVIRNPEARDATEQLQRAWSSLSGQVRDKTFLAGLGDMIRAFEGDTASGGFVKMGTNFIASWVPNLARASMRATDPNIRDMRIRKQDNETLGSKALAVGKQILQQAFPVAANAPAVRRDWMGRPIEKTERLGPATDVVWRILTGMKVQEVPEADALPTKLDRFVWNYNHKAERMGLTDHWWPGATRGEMMLPGRPNDPSRKRYMTDDEFERFQKERGELFLKRAGRFTWDPENPRQQQMQFLKKLYEETTEQVKRQMVIARMKAEKSAI